MMKRNDFGLQVTLLLYAVDRFIARYIVKSVSEVNTYLTLAEDGAGASMNWHSDKRGV